MKGDGQGHGTWTSAHPAAELDTWRLERMCELHGVHPDDVLTVSAVLTAWLEKTTGVAEPITLEHARVGVDVIRALRRNGRARRIAAPGGTTS